MKMLSGRIVELTCRTVSLPSIDPSDYIHPHSILFWCVFWFRDSSQCHTILLKIQTKKLTCISVIEREVVLHRRSCPINKHFYQLFFVPRLTPVMQISNQSKRLNPVQVHKMVYIPFLIGCDPTNKILIHTSYHFQWYLSLY